MARVIFDRVSKLFGDVVALDDMELEVHDREFLVMVGPSGCGKSTALRLVAGLEQPTAGHIYIGNRLVDELAPKDRDVAMVFQSYALYPHMTAFDNIGHPLKLRGLPKVEIQQRVQRAAMMLGWQIFFRASRASYPAGNARELLWDERSYEIQKRS